MGATMNIDIPPGFQPVDLGKGFTNELGQMFVDSRQQRLGMIVQARHGNPVDVMHGGAMSTFLDCQLVAVCPEALGGLNHRPTISLTVDFLAPVPIGVWLEAAVLCVRETRSLLFTQAIATVDGEAVARASAIYKNIKKELQS